MYIIFIFVITFIFSSCNFDVESIKIKDEIKISDVRPKPNVISEKEVFDTVTNELITEYYDDVLEFVNHMPEAENTEIGGIILVEDWASPVKEKKPYYYYVFGVLPDGSISVDAKVNAMANDPSAGRLAQVSVINSNCIRERFVSSNEAIEYVRKKYNITNKLVAKAVLVPNDYDDFFSWGWAIKSEEEVIVKSINNNTYKAKYFFVHPYDYINYEEVKEKKGYYLKTKTKLGILNMDVFNENTSKGFRPLNLINENVRKCIIPIEDFYK